MRILPQGLMTASQFGRRLAAAISVSGVALACGGGGAGGGGVQSPGAAASASAPASSESAPLSASAGATTTTATLAVAGDARGTKLTETDAAPPANTVSVPMSPHGHDPGRGSSDIRAIIIAHRDEARACYERALMDHPGIEGDLVISWTVDPKGKVTETALDTSRSQLAEPTVVSCVSEVIRRIQFAPSPGGFETKASYPFNFHPRRARPAQ